MFDKLRNKKRELPPLFSESELDDLSPAVNYNTVLDWLGGLSDKDYEAVIKVANIYRNAARDESAVLGTPIEPTSFIHPPEPEANLVVVDKDVHHLDHQKPKSFLEDDDISSAFLDDDDQPPKKKTAKKVKVTGRDR